MNSQGYITIATGENKYLQMAKFLALSVKLNDKKRTIALITDENMEVEGEVAELFSHIIRIPQKEGYVGCLDKLRVYDYSPFEETMFLDSDCLIVKDDMDRHWDNFKSYDFNLAGNKMTQGRWYNFDIAKVLQEMQIPYVVKMNSGMFYFKKNNKAEEFFALTNHLVANQSNLIGCSHRVEQQIADEPFLGAAMGALSIDPVGYSAEEGSIMVTTVCAKGCKFDPVKHVSQLKKPTGFYILNRLWAKSWVTHSPSVAHFVQLKPISTYIAACNALADCFSLPRVTTEFK